ncbi:flagellar hook-length control protein FliK [Hyphomicrobium sp.]|uniref:flagellar hook-length control protein FliK n=1 Tax=Hyphomicrobium sp. TaxID=82 RepID=UPI001D5282F4|nr:flagellar hook-length control protein FliK [Hyphomicrobium sp.]MBY0562033.1 flagellar hook-length control protein FliK [Hyphomicrobium sp.]
MTAPVRGAAPDKVDQLLQSVRMRVGSHRDTAKQSREGDDKPDDVTKDTTKAKASSSDNSIRRSDSVSTRKQGSSKADDGDSSFEETFDSIGQQETKANTSVERSDNGPPITIAAVVNGPVDQAPDSVEQQPSDNMQRAARPGNLLLQDSIAALLDAKSRQVPSDDNTKLAQAAMPNAMPLEHRNEIGDVTPAVVNSQETHWNFAETTVAAAASQVSRLAPEERITLHPLASAPFSLPRPPTMEQRNPDPSVKTSNDSLPQLQPQAVSAAAMDTRDNSFLADKDQTGARFQQQATGDVVSSKVAKADASDSNDRIFSIEPKPSQQGQPSVSAQIRNGVIDALAGKAAALAPNTTAMDLQDRAPAPTPVLRSLDLTLSPADLGSVRLHLSLKSNSLAIEAEASKAATAKILNDDRASLERGLRDAGYDVASLKITEASSSNSASSNGQTSGSPFRDGDQARSNFTGRQDGDAQRRDGSSSDQAARRQKDNSQQTSAGDLPNSRQGNAVYI